MNDKGSLQRVNMLKKLIATLTAITMLFSISVNAAPITLKSATIGSGKANLLYIQMGDNLTASVITAKNTVNSDLDAKAIIKSAEIKDKRIIAAINGGFFNAYYKADKEITFPSNAPLIYASIVREGKLITGQGNVNAVGFFEDGSVKIDRIAIKASVRLNNKSDIRLWAVNSENKNSEAVLLFTPDMTLPFTMPDSSLVVTAVDGVVTNVANGGTHTVANNQIKLVFNEGAVKNHKGWSLIPKVGDTLQQTTTYVSDTKDDWSGVSALVGGGLLLVKDSVAVVGNAAYNAEVSADPKQGANNALQRSFVATLPNNVMIFGTVKSSFNDIAKYLVSIGAKNAVSLDGGASSMLYSADKGYVTAAGRKLTSVIVVYEDVK